MPPPVTVDVIDFIQFTLLPLRLRSRHAQFIKIRVVGVNFLQFIPDFRTRKQNTLQYKHVTKTPGHYTKIPSLDKEGWP
jgi:hypothetical protein